MVLPCPCQRLGVLICRCRRSHRWSPVGSEPIRHSLGTVDETAASAVVQPPIGALNSTRHTSPSSSGGGLLEMTRWRLARQGQLESVEASFLGPTDESGTPSKTPEQPHHA